MADYEGDWDLHLPAAVIGLNNKIHGVTGYSRYEIMFRRCAETNDSTDNSRKESPDERFFDDGEVRRFVDQRSRAMSDVFVKVSQNILKGQKKQRDGYNRVNRKKSRIVIGSKVYIS